MNLSKIKTAVDTALQTVLSLQPEEIQPQKKLVDEYLMDELNSITVLMAIEEQLEVQMFEIQDHLDDDTIVTVNDLYEAVAKYNNVAIPV